MVGDNRTNHTIVCRRKSQILLAPLSVIVGKMWRSFSRIRHVIPILTIFSKVPHLTVTVVSPPPMLSPPSSVILQFHGYSLWNWGRAEGPAKTWKHWILDRSSATTLSTAPLHYNYTDEPERLETTVDILKHAYKLLENLQKYDNYGYFIPGYDKTNINHIWA